MTERSSRGIFATCVPTFGGHGFLTSKCFLCHQFFSLSSWNSVNQTFRNSCSSACLHFLFFHSWRGYSCVSTCESCTHTCHANAILYLTSSSWKASTAMVKQLSFIQLLLYHGAGTSHCVELCDVTKGHISHGLWQLSLEEQGGSCHKWQLPPWSIFSW